MDGVRFLVPSPSRISRLVAKMRDKLYRDSYVASHTRQFLARQMRAFRGSASQAEFGKSLGVPQSVVSQRFENPNYGKWNLQSLFDIASKLDVAVIVRFVDYDTFVKLTDDMSEEAIRPLSWRKKPAQLTSQLTEAAAPKNDWRRRPWAALSESFRQKRRWVGVEGFMPASALAGNGATPSEEIAGSTPMPGPLLQQAAQIAQAIHLGGANG